METPANSLNVVRRSGERDGDGALELRPRAQPKCDLGDDAERSPRSGEETSEIKSSDVLHYAAAAAHHTRVAGDEFEAEHDVARKAEVMRQRPDGRSRDRCADRAVVGAVGIERQPLAGRAGDARDLGERRAGANGDGEIARYVLRDAADGRRRQARRRGYRPIRVEPGAAAHDAQGFSSLDSIAD